MLAMTSIRSWCSSRDLLPNQIILNAVISLATVVKLNVKTAHHEARLQNRFLAETAV